VSLAAALVPSVKELADGILAVASLLKVVGIVLLAALFLKTYKEEIRTILKALALCIHRLKSGAIGPVKWTLQFGPENVDTLDAPRETLLVPEDFESERGYLMSSDQPRAPELDPAQRYSRIIQFSRRKVHTEDRKD